MSILGINAYHGDLSAVLLRDGELLAAVAVAQCRQEKQEVYVPEK
mgnify:CR=1 FL=1